MFAVAAPVVSNPAGGTSVYVVQTVFLRPDGVAARHMHDIASAAHSDPGLLRPPSAAVL
jgi:hypothetical protein